MEPFANIRPEPASNPGLEANPRSETASQVPPPHVQGAERQDQVGTQSTIIAAFEKEQFLKRHAEQESVQLTGAPDATILLRPKKPLPPPGQPLFTSSASAPSDKYGVFRVSAGDSTREGISSNIDGQAKRELMRNSNRLQRLLGRATGDVSADRSTRTFDAMTESDEDKGQLPE